MKILLVDDDAFLRDMYATKFVEHAGMMWLLADGGASTLSSLGLGKAVPTIVALNGHDNAWHKLGLSSLL
jgi:hypothetical protein